MNSLPNTILLEIFSYIPLPERWLVSSVCKTWHSISHDPYLYQHLLFENLEYKTLILCLQKIITISPRVKSLVIRGCHSNFIQNTVVSVPFSNRATNSPGGPTLFSHITALQPQRRREEYCKHNFELHDQFSDAVHQLFGLSQNHLKTLVVQDCTLDLEMTELFCAITCHSRALETLVYHGNHDKGIHSSGMLQAIITACPNMRHFRGLHYGMDDAVLMTMSRHWKSLESLTLCSLKTCTALGQVDIISDGQQLMGTSPTGRISSRALWQLLYKCNQLKTLELDDLACVSNQDLSNFETMLEKETNTAKQSPPPQQQRYNKNKNNKTIKRYSPYILPSSKPLYPTSATQSNKALSINNNAGLSTVQHLIISKFMTTSLSKSGLENLTRLFPELSCLEYRTNYYTFDNLFGRVSRDTFISECHAVKQWFEQKQSGIKYIGKWDCEITPEQRLMAGMASVSEGGA